MQLYRFVKATEDNLPEDGEFVLVRYKFNYSSITSYVANKGRAYLKMLLNMKNVEQVEWQQPVTIADDWEEEFKKDFCLRHANGIDYTATVIEWIKSKLLAPLKKEDVDLVGFIKWLTKEGYTLQRHWEADNINSLYERFKNDKDTSNSIS
jgi:hypothetical protein